jgi:hypothetical protein
LASDWGACGVDVVRSEPRWSGQCRLDVVGGFVFWCCWYDDVAALFILVER